MVLRLFTYLVSAVALVTFVLFAWDVWQGAFDGSSPADFPNYYFAGRRLFETRPVYGDLAFEVKNTLGWEYNVYPADTPLTVLLLSPLSQLPYQVAWSLLALFSVAAMAGVAYWTGIELGHPRHVAWLCAALSLMSAPFLFLLKRNHMESLVLVAGAAGWLLLRRGRASAGMLLWGMAAALKLFPALWILLAWHRGVRRPVMIGMLAAAFFSLIGMVGVGFSDTIFFITQVVPRAAQWFDAIGNYSLVALGSVLVGPSLGWLLVLSVGLLSFSPRFWISGGWDEFWLKAVCLSLLLTPLAWLNYLVLLIPGLMAMGTFLKDTAILRRYFFYALVMMTCFCPTDITIAQPWLRVLIIFAPTFGMLAILLWKWSRGFNRTE